jgi:hypothetical protein
MLYVISLLNKLIKKATFIVVPPAVQTNRCSCASYDASSSIVSGNRCAINWITSVIVILTHQDAAGRPNHTAG